MPGRCLLSVSLLSVQRRTSSPVVTAQVEKACEAAAPAQPTKTSRRPRGRPKGSKNRNRRAVECSPSRRLIQEGCDRAIPNLRVRWRRRVSRREAVVYQPVRRRFLAKETPLMPWWQCAQPSCPAPGAPSMIPPTPPQVLWATTRQPVGGQLSGSLARGAQLMDPCLPPAPTPQQMATVERARRPL